MTTLTGPLLLPRLSSPLLYMECRWLIHRQEQEVSVRIGIPERTFEVVPLAIPVPAAEPAEEPVPEPAEEPVLVP